MNENTPDLPSNKQVWAWLKAKVGPVLFILGVLALGTVELGNCVAPFREATWHGAHLCGINSTSQRDENEAAHLVTYQAGDTAESLDECFRREWEQKGYVHLRSATDSGVISRAYRAPSGREYSYAILRAPGEREWTVMVGWK